MAGCHPGNALQQRAALPSGGHGVDGHRAAPAAGGVFIEQQLALGRALQPYEGAIGIADIDVVHRKHLHLVPKPLTDGTHIAFAPGIAAQPVEVEIVDPDRIAEFFGQADREIHHGGVLAVDLAELQAAAASQGVAEQAEPTSD